jgi:amino acid transporter
VFSGISYAELSGIIAAEGGAYRCVVGTVSCRLLAS